MTASAIFHGRLFGPGIDGAGVAANGQWEDGTLVLHAAGETLAVADNALQIEAAGFNVHQMRLSWHAAQGEYALFIAQPDDKARFFQHAPASLHPAKHLAEKRERRVRSQFHTGLLVYGLLLALPFIILAVFMLNTDRVAGWAASKVPLEVEARIGSMVLAQTRARTKLSESGPAYDAVKTIGTRLTEGSRYSYRWFVAEGPEVNAFAAPGGVVVIYTGLIRQTAVPEELAGVIAHEVAHVELRHSLKNLIKSAGFGVLLSLAIGDWTGSAVGGWIANLTDLKFSRDAEMEADRAGLNRLTQAGIAPQPMANFFAKMAKEEGKASRALSILATHPPSQERMATLQKLIDALPPQPYAPLDMDWRKVQVAIKE